MLKPSPLLKRHKAGQVTSEIKFKLTGEPSTFASGLWGGAEGPQQHSPVGGRSGLQCTAIKSGSALGNKACPSTLPLQSLWGDSLWSKPLSNRIACQTNSSPLHVLLWLWGAVAADTHPQGRAFNPHFSKNRRAKSFGLGGGEAEQS